MARNDAPLPGPIPFTNTSALRNPDSKTAFFNVDSVVTVAACGVDFLVPENPYIPHDPVNNGLPSLSVTVTIVLLNVAVI